MPWGEVLFALATVLAGYVVLGLSGFGSALVVVPLLSWHWPLTVVVPLVLLIDVPASLLHTRLNLRHVAWQEIPRLVPAMLVGALLGVALLRWTRSAWPLLALGSYVAFIGLRGLHGLRKAAPVTLASPRWAWPAGLAMGLVESMFGTTGPVVVAWLSRRLSDPVALRATLPMTIVIVAVMAIVAAMVGGQMAQPLLWQAWPVLQPVALAGVVLGHLVARRMPSEWVRRAVFGLLVLSGLAMVGRSAQALAGA